MHLICFSFLHYLKVFKDRKVLYVDSLPFEQCCQCRQRIDTLPPTLSLHQHWQCWQEAAHIIYVSYDSLKSYCHWCIRGVVQILTAFKSHLHNWLLLQVTQTSNIPGSLMKSGNSLWPRVCYWWLDDLPYRHIVVHFSYSLNKVSFIKRCQTLLIFRSYMFTLSLDRKEETVHPSLSLAYNNQLRTFGSHGQSKIISTI